MPTVAPTAVPTASHTVAPTVAPPSAEPTRDPRPDGSGEAWIVYQARQGSGDGIFLMRPDGAAIHSIPGPWTEHATHPEWSPDGSRIAFEWSNDGIDSIVAVDPDGANQAIVVRSIDCGAGCHDWPGYPAWSHDGLSVAYVRIDDDGSSVVRSTLEVVDLATGSTRVVYVAPEGTVLGNPRWSPTGDRLVFGWTSYDGDFGAGAGTGAAIAVISVTSPGSKPRDLTDPAMFAAYPDWHPTEDLIVFSTYDLAEYQQTDEPSNLYTIAADGSGLTKLTTYGPGEQRATQPTWTPDGLSVIFTYVANANTGWDGPRAAAILSIDGGNVDTIGLATHPRLRPIP